MIDPIEVVQGYNVDTEPRTIQFGYPMRQIDISNDGSNDILVKFPHSDWYTIKKYESLDIDANIPFTQIIVKTNSGSTLLRAMGTRDFPKQDPTVPYPKPKVYTNNSTVTNEIVPNWVPILLGLALLGAFAVALYSISKH